MILAAAVVAKKVNMNEHVLSAPDALPGCSNMTTASKEPEGADAARMQWLAVHFPEVRLWFLEGQSRWGIEHLPGAWSTLRDAVDAARGAQPQQSLAEVHGDERTAVLAAAKDVGLIAWISDDGDHFTFSDCEVMSDKLVALWRRASKPQPKGLQPVAEVILSGNGNTAVNWLSQPEVGSMLYAGPVQAPAPAPEFDNLRRDYARALDSIKGHVAWIKAQEQHIRELRAFQAMVNRHSPEFPADPKGIRDVWYWQGDGHDHLESMTHQLPIVIRAEQLRELLAEAKSSAPAVVDGEPVAWMYEHDGCKDAPILTVRRWPECREPWTETPLYAAALGASCAVVTVRKGQP